MFNARITQITQIDTDERVVPGEDAPVIRYPNPQIRRFKEGDRTVLELQMPADAVAEFNRLGGEIELQIVPVEAGD